MRLKPFIASAAHQVSYATSISTFTAKALKVGRIIMFHGVGTSDYPAEVFEFQITFLKKHFRIVSLEEFVTRLEQKKSLTNEIVLTFDDGLRNNLTFAYPVLQRLGVPATFFVCPGLIGSHKWLWNQEARARLNSLNQEQRQRFASQCNSTADTAEEIVAWMKNLPLASRQQIEARLREATVDFEPAPEQRVQYDLMNWDELRSLDTDWITIGSHTVNHPILSTLEPEELEFEITQSRCLLEQKLHRQVEFFCYPNGSFNKAVAEQARKTYRCALTSDEGFVTKGCDLHLLPRVCTTEKTPLLAWRLHRPRA